MPVLATAQTHVGPDIAANGREVRNAVAHAAASGARLVHFAEAALSGYPRPGHRWTAAGWSAMEAELDSIRESARRHGIWVVLGAAHRLRAPLFPHNSLYVISDTGVLAGRYDKRMCSNTESTYFYTPGRAPLAFDLDGVRFGCATCIEVVFPPLFAEYAALGVEVMLLSAFSSDPVHGLMAQAHAATQCVWLSLATPVACSSGLPASVTGPDGHRVAAARPGVPALLLHDIDKDCPRYRVALTVARPWRARALAGHAMSHGRPANASGARHQRQANSGVIPEAAGAAAFAASTR